MEGVEKKSKFNFWFPLSVGIFINLLVLFKYIYLPLSLTERQANLIYKGIVVQGVEIGGLNSEEAINKLNNVFRSAKEENIYFILKNNPIVWDTKDIQYHYDINTAVKGAVSYGKIDGNIIQRTIKRYKIMKDGYGISLNIIFDERHLDEVIKSLSIKINKAPEDAKIVFNNDVIETVKEVDGITVDESKLKERIKNSIIKGNYPVEIPIINIKPKISEKMLIGKYIKVSEFSTPILSKNITRTKNIKIASNYVTGTIILPGEVFSANRAIGPRTVERGYGNAPIFAGGKVISGLGGGICQLVTTLYNAALQCDLKIVERKRHGQKVNYVKSGMDATISGNVVDFKFKNTKDKPIYVQAYVGNNRVFVNFYIVEDSKEI